MLPFTYNPLIRFPDGFWQLISQSLNFTYIRIAVEWYTISVERRVPAAKKLLPLFLSFNL